MSQPIMCGRPSPDEYSEYFGRYIERVPAGDVIEFLGAQLVEFESCFGALPEHAHHFSYGEGKWSVNQLLGHILDTEWIFTTRCLWFARGNSGPLPGMDQDEFVAGADFDSRSLSSLMSEFGHLRRGAIDLFKSLDEGVLSRSGVASETRLTVRSIIYLIAGHADHHMEVLRERYLPQLPS